MSTAEISTETWHGTCGGYTNHACRCDACRAAARGYYRDFSRRWREEIRTGARQLPEIDWAVCARGGTAAQAMAHRRRGQKPCPACLRAETATSLARRARRKASQ